jgi:hypothetical protein
MSASQIVLRGHKAQLLVAIAVIAIACRHSYTYDPHIQSVSLPPGVNSDASRFRAQVAMRAPGPTHSYGRPSSKCSGCRVQVVIGPLGNTREVNPALPALVPLPAIGRAVAKIVNLDSTGVEEMYGFRPSTEFEYYVWADTAGSTARMTLLEVPAVRQPGVVRAIFQKNLTRCTGHLPPAISDADFKWCKDVHLSTGLNVTYAGMWGVKPPFAALLSRLSDFVAERLSVETPPIWLGCLSGCCG